MGTANFELTPSRIILGGLVVFLSGIIWAFGADVYSYAKDWLLSPTIGSRFLISTLLVAVGVAVVTYGIYAMLKQIPIVGISAHLFFPQGTVPSEKMAEYHEEQRFRHRLIVNTKRVPPVAYPLFPKSYSWRLIEKHPELAYSEVDEAPNDPDFERKWSEEHGYSYEPKSPSREDLLASDFMAMGDVTTPLDPRLKDAYARYFFFAFSESDASSCRFQSFDYDGMVF